MLCVTWCPLMTLSIFLGLGLPAPSAYAQDSFYKGKTIRFIVGAPPGGGFDTYSRALSRHLGKHISGNPTMLVDNMPGAAGLVAANYVYKASRPDGFSVGTFVGGRFKEILSRKSLRLLCAAGAALCAEWLCSRTAEYCINARA